MLCGKPETYDSAMPSRDVAQPGEWIWMRIASMTPAHEESDGRSNSLCMMKDSAGTAPIENTAALLIMVCLTPKFRGARLAWPKRAVVEASPATPS